MKEKELEVGFDFALFEAVHHYARLSDVARAHATGMARAAASHLKAPGAQWSDAALFDLCVHAFLIHNATWLYWRISGGFDRRAIERLADAVIALAAPAMEGKPEPIGPHLTAPPLAVDLMSKSRCRSGTPLSVEAKREPERGKIEFAPVAPFGQEAPAQAQHLCAGRTRNGPLDEASGSASSH